MSERVIFGLIGFVLGGFAGFAVAHRMLGKDYSERLEALKRENEELARQRRAAAEKDISEREKAVAEAEEDAPKDIPSPTLTDEDFEPRTPVHKILNKNAYDEALKRYGGDPKAKTEAENIYSPIRVVTEQFFIENQPYMEEHQLIFYQGDGVLTDVKNVIVDDEEGLIGLDAQDLLEVTKNDTIYVVNETENCLIEVNIEHDSCYKDLYSAE